MSSDSFRLESFRPWNPFQDKAQPLRDSVDICRYPSPVSITATSLPSNSTNSASKNPNVHSHKSERHPLPPRPPVEVCLNDSLPQESNTQHQHHPAVEDQISCINPGVEAFDFNDILHLQDLPSSGDEDHPINCDNLGPESQCPLNFESGDLGLACTTSQQSQVGKAGSSGLASECCDPTIDPAILDDYHFQDMEPTPARKETSDVVAPSRSLGKSVRGRGMRPNSQRAMKPGRQQSKISKVAVVVDNRHMNRTGRSARASGPVKMSFSILRDQFSSLPVEERLQFLSWLFEGALSHCVSTRANLDTASVSGCISSQAVDLTDEYDHSGSSTELVDAQPTRKGLPWSMEENCLLVSLREEQNLAWSEVTRLFAKKFPGRSKGSLQVYWSTTLKKQRLSLADAA
jgi:hypothetical protein